MISLLLEENMKVDGCGPVNIMNSLILLKIYIYLRSNTTFLQDIKQNIRMVGNVNT